MMLIVRAAIDVAAMAGAYYIGHRAFGSTEGGICLVLAVILYSLWVYADGLLTGLKH